MKGLYQIKANGTNIPLHRKSLTLAEMQELVATGTKNPVIERVAICGYGLNRPGHQVMIVHEEGKIHNLPVNKVAGALVMPGVGPILGDIIIVENEAEDFT